MSKLAVRVFIKKRNEMHETTVILTTHDMQDIEALTKRIILIGKGRILMDGNLEDIKKGNAGIDETLAEWTNRRGLCYNNLNNRQEPKRHRIQIRYKPST